MIKGACNFMSLIVKVISQQLALALATTDAFEIQCLINLSFNSTLQLINRILSDCQLRYVNSTAIVPFPKIPPAISVFVFPKNLAYT